MTDNVEFRKLQKRLEHAGSDAEKITLIRQLLELDPSYVGLSSQRKDYRKMLDTILLKRRAKKRGNVPVDEYCLPGYDLRGAILGTPNVGKSTLLNHLTDSSAKVADFPFTTYRPEVGMMGYNGVSIQLIEIPPIFKGDYESRAVKYNLIRSARGLGILIATEGDLEIVVDELTKAGISLMSPKDVKGKDRSDNTKPAFVVYRGVEPFDIGIPFVPVEDETTIKDLFYECLGVVMVYARKGGKRDGQPFVLDTPATVGDFARKVDKDYKDRFRCAQVWGNSVRQSGQHVVFDHVLNEGDEIYLLG